jgi:hypothetical protein
MDADTVIAVGSLVHDLLGLIGGIILCYFGYRLLKRRIRVQPATGKWSWEAAKMMLKNGAPGTMFALIGAVQIWLIAAKGLHSEGGFSNSAATKTLFESKKENGTSPLLTLNSMASSLEPGSSSVNSPLNSPTFSLGPKMQVASPSSGQSTASDWSQGSVTTSEANKRAPETRNLMGKTDRRNLEKRRMAAEKKRSRLEAMYQSGTISNETYRSGEAEYRIAIQRYRDQVSAVQANEN